MPVIRSAGAVVFREDKKIKERLYLVLQHPDSDSRTGKSASGHWDFPKGHLERGERTEDTVRREVREETGIRALDIIPGFKATIRYFVSYTGARTLKFVAYFLARTKEEEVTISHEHQGYEWLPYTKAHARLTYKNAKDVLKRAHDYLSEEGI